MTKKQSQSVTRTPISLPQPQPRIHRKEFLFTVRDMTEVQKAGFIAYCGGKEWMRLSEWRESLEQYKNRKL
jgi:hypothetical protein